MGKRLIRGDEFGTYILTGGYAFRPPLVANREFFPNDPVHASAAAAALDLKEAGESQLDAGLRVKAHHVGGTTTALVHDEVWVSSSVDPRYVGYTATREEPTHG